MTSVQDVLIAAVGDGRGTAAADRLCVASVELFAVDAAAISLVFDGANMGTLGVSSARARVYDELQFTLGEGPCLDSVAGRGPVLVADLADLADLTDLADVAEADGSGPWSAYGPAMLAHGVRAVFAMPILVAGEYVGAFDLFRDTPGPLPHDELAGALVAAELAELPLLDLLGGDLQAAVTDPDSDGWAELNLISRAEVNQATGMLVGQLGVTPAEALVRLRAHAWVTGRSASDVARDILDRRLILDADR